MFSTCYRQIAYVLSALLFSVDALSNEVVSLHDTSVYGDSTLLRRDLIHRLEVDLRPSYIIPTIPFFQGENSKGKQLRAAFSGHLKYAFQPQQDTPLDRIYEGVYQGVGLGKYTFGNREELGSPIAAYFFQGARIAKLNSRLSVNYEWNFGVSTGWNPYHNEQNTYNHAIGSDVNAYLHVNFYLNWMLSDKVDFMTGLHVTHFSNGNTEIPNAGVNTVGLRTGLAYHFNRKNQALPSITGKEDKVLPEFPRHISYDIIAFGGWRKKGVPFLESFVASPHTYKVFGASFSAMYHVDYKLRVGPSIDGVYDGSANVYAEDYIVGTQQRFYSPAIEKQMAVGVSARAEYVMPYFIAGLGLGVNVLHGGGDMKGTYQMLTLKAKVTRSSFLHIGYNLKDFHEPNFLMLGIGFRLNNRYPIIR